jgi:SAM-dependent methyltransferase
VDIDDPELDPRLAAQYDLDNPWGEDLDFFVALIAAHPGCRVADVGCGTGRLTVALAADGQVVTGVDPNPAFLAIAAAKEGAARVRWIRGTSADLPHSSFDVVLMTSHVAQEFLSDEEWAANLSNIKRALVPGGTVAFDARDPAARAWESWATGPAVQGLPDGSVLRSSTTLRYVTKSPGSRARC